MFDWLFDFAERKKTININGCRVVSPFEYFSKIDIGEINIGPEVLAIKESAFESCTSLETINIHDNIHLIDVKAFYNTKYYDNPENWQDGALYIGNNLIKVDNTYEGVFTVRPGTTLIAAEAFGNECASCKLITEVILPDTLKYICPSAFENCIGLKKIIIPDSVVSIGVSAFKNCESLESVQVNAQLKVIPESCFACCTNLKTVNLPDSINKIDRLAFSQCYHLKDIVFPNELEVIGAYAFQHCSELTSITIPESIKLIDTAAFSVCWRLSEINLPNKVFEIKNAVFNSTEYSRNKNNWQQGALYIGPHLINVVDEGLYFTVKPGTITIAAEAFFEEFKKLPFTKITLPDTLQYIGDRAFGNCVNLCEINLPSSMIGMGRNVFQRCRSLETICFPGSLTTIPFGVCSSCVKLQNVYIEKGIRHIDSDAFKDCKSLLEITIPFNLTFEETSFDDYTKITRC